jgi:DNA-binding NarL/FixJ family response regulator
MPAKRAPPVTVAAVDDQAIFSRAVRELIAATPGFPQVGQAASGPQALELAAELRRDLVLLDVRLPRHGWDRDGAATACGRPEAVVVLISLDEVRAAPSVASVGMAAHVRKQHLLTRRFSAISATHGGSRATL